MLRTHRPGKGPGGCGGWGLGSKNGRGPGAPPTPGLRGGGNLTLEPSIFPVLEWSGQMPSAPLLLLLDGSSCLPLLISLHFLLCPQDQCGWGEGGLGGQGTGLGTQQPPQAAWAGQMTCAPLLLLLEGPSQLPILISLASGAPILSGLHFSYPPHPPMFYQFTWGFLPSPWASGSPTSSRQAP